MRRIRNTVAGLFIVVLLCSFSDTIDFPQPVTSGNSNETEILLDCDTIIDENGYAVHIIRENGEDVFLGLNLFSDEMKNAMDIALLNRIETDLYKIIRSTRNTPEIVTKVIKGNITDFKSIGQGTPCRVTSTNSKYMVAEWDVNGKFTKVEIPVSYETAKGSNRSKTENAMLERFKKSDGKRNDLNVDRDNLESYGVDLFLLPGGSYHSKNITRNIYLDSSLLPIWDIRHPAESIADVFLCPSDKYGNVELLLTVLKHEYGEKETISTSVNKVISEFERDGCIPFWGIEKISDGILEGALFFYNQKQGYDHVLKIECNPDEVINGKGQIKARASLFIPTNNVDNLYSPYIKKSKKERIDYEKK